ncbi:MAPEG family protein [uncultured Maricaulis sp.]|uniref:MAPEG family protein n=1 Tax=uncultured Maricaulis sp. TaxID=174710 RepID=UPI0030DC2B42
MELWMVLASVGILVAGIGFQAVVGTADNGSARQLGPRDDYGQPSTLAGRGERAVRNQVESLVMFVPVIMVAQLADVHTAMTVLGAQIFVISRVFYMPLYWLGVPILRTIAFTGGVVGMLMILTAIVQAA